MQASKEIDWLANEVVAPFMRKHGFKRRRLAFARPFEHGFDILVLQKSNWNSAADARFTINLGICWSKAEEVMGSPVSGVPFSGHETVSERIGFLMKPPKDKWWIVSGQHHVLDLPEEVVHAIESCAFPWFTAGHSIDTSIELAIAGRHTATIRALKWLRDEWIG